MDEISKSFLTSKFANVFSSSYFRLIKWLGTSPIQIKSAGQAGLTDCVARQVLKLALDDLDFILEHVDHFSELLRADVLVVHLVQKVVVGSGVGQPCQLASVARHGSEGQNGPRASSSFSHIDSL